VSAIMTWSSANNSVDSYWVFEGLIPVMACFCHYLHIWTRLRIFYLQAFTKTIQLTFQKSMRWLSIQYHPP